MADAPISEELTALKKRARRRLVGAFALVLAALIILWTVMDDKPPQSLASQPVTIVSTEPALTSTVQPDPKAPATPQPTLQPVATPTPAPVVVTVSPTPTPTPTPTPSPVQTTQEVSPSLVTPTPPAAEPKPVATPHDAKPSVPKPAAHVEAAAKKPDPTLTPKKPSTQLDPAKILAGADDTSNSKHTSAALASDNATSRFFVQLGAFADADKAKAVVGKAGAAGVNVQNEKLSTDKGDLHRLRAGPYTSREAAEHARDKLAAAGLAGNVVSK